MKISGKEQNVLGKKEEYEMTEKGKMQAGTFWAQHVSGDEIFVQVKCQDKPAEENGNFVVDKVAVGYGPEHEYSGRTRRAALCGEDDKENAICYSESAEYNKASAVARLLIQGSWLCTGWLASASNHIMTNEHCITDGVQALNTDYEFMAEAPGCGDANCQLCHPGEKFSGAIFISDNATLDYALVQINSTGDPAATYGLLQIDNRVAEVGEQIYIPQHPGGRAKELGTDSSHDSDSSFCQVYSTTVSPCSGSGYDDVGCKSMLYCAVFYLNVVR